MGKVSLMISKFLKLHLIQGVDVSIMLNHTLGGGQRCRYKGSYLMIVSFLNLFMKSFVVGTHYNPIVDKILICYHSNNFYGEINKEFL